MISNKLPIIPLTCGEAMDVPENDLYPFPGTAETTKLPGAVTSGLILLDPSITTGLTRLTKIQIEPFA
jgi:hypothetical protein